MANNLKINEYKWIKGRCKTFEKECERREKISKTQKGNTNWKYNKTRGNSKKGWYKGIFCDSTWELAFVVYYIEHNKNIKRCTEYLKYNYNNEEHLYLPDFITDEGIVEIKGRCDDKFFAKHKQYPNIKVIDSTLIKPYLKYVIDIYGIEFWKCLYEENKNNIIVKNKKLIKQEEKQKKINILKNACKDSEIDFKKYGWAKKLRLYLTERNELFSNKILDSLTRYFPDFFEIYKPYLRKSVKSIKH